MRQELNIVVAKDDFIVAQVEHAEIGHVAQRVRIKIDDVVGGDVQQLQSLVRCSAEQRTVGQVLEIVPVKSDTSEVSVRWNKHTGIYTGIPPSWGMIS